MIKCMIVGLTLMMLAACGVVEPTILGQGIALNLGVGELDQGFLSVLLPDDHPNNLSIKTSENEWYVLQDATVPVYIVPQLEFNAATNVKLDAKMLKEHCVA